MKLLFYDILVSKCRRNNYLFLTNNVNKKILHYNGLIFSGINKNMTMKENHCSLAKIVAICSKKDFNVYIKL